MYIDEDKIKYKKSTLKKTAALTYAHYPENCFTSILYFIMILKIDFEKLIFEKWISKIEFRKLILKIDFWKIDFENWFKIDFWKIEFWKLNLKIEFRKLILLQILTFSCQLYD